MDWLIVMALVAFAVYVTNLAAVDTARHLWWKVRRHDCRG